MKIVSLVKPVFFNLTYQHVAIDNAVIIPRKDVSEIFPANDTIDEMLDKTNPDLDNIQHMFKHIIINSKSHTVNEILLIGNILTILAEYYDNTEGVFTFYNVVGNELVEVDGKGLLETINKIEEINDCLTSSGRRSYDRRDRCGRNGRSNRRCRERERNKILEDTLYFRELKMHRAVGACYLSDHDKENPQRSIVPTVRDDEVVELLLADLYRYAGDMKVRYGVVSGPARPQSEAFTHTAITNITGLEKALTEMKEKAKSDYVAITLNGDKGTIDFHVTA